VQFLLGAWTIWSNKAADVATAHVFVGALTFMTGVLLSVVLSRMVSSSRHEGAPEILRKEVARA
jgi:heme a synthase